MSAGDSSEHSCHNKKQSPSIAAGTRRVAGCPTQTHGVAYGRCTCAALWPCSAHHSVLEAVRRLATVLHRCTPSQPSHGPPPLFFLCIAGIMPRQPRWQLAPSRP